MAKQKKSPKREEKQEANPSLCTECGEALDNFCFDDNVVDIKGLKKNRENCEKTGKANGHLCSKLFIAEPVDPELLNDDD
jgi:hypothetical protein